MALPKLEAPIFELTLPSTESPIRYRPFLVKEQKILLIAMESESETDMTNAIKQIVNNCAVDKVDVDKMPIFDLEYFFTRLRAKSVGEQVELRLQHGGRTVCSYNKLQTQSAGSGSGERRRAHRQDCD
jgi:hypothetical protein